MDNNYICFKVDEPKVTLYPLVCMHIGSPQCDIKFLREHIARVRKDPTARWVYMGDGGECVTKTSKGDIWEQLLSPQAQMEFLIDLLEPIADKALFGIRGNHGHRVYKETGLSFDHTLCSIIGMPYLGVAAFCNMLLRRSSYDLYCHHGSESGTSLNSKITKAEHFAKFIDADAILTAHSHIALGLTPAPLMQCDNNSRKVRTKLRHQYICGCAYDSRTGYAEDKAYSPLLPAYLSIEFDGRIIEGKPQHAQKYTIYRSDGSYKLEHDYIQKYALGRLE